MRAKRRRKNKKRKRLKKEIDEKEKEVELKERKYWGVKKRGKKGEEWDNLPVLSDDDFAVDMTPVLQMRHARFSMKTLLWVGYDMLSLRIHQLQLPALGMFWNSPLNFFKRCIFWSPLSYDNDWHSRHLDLTCFSTLGCLFTKKFLLTSFVWPFVSWRVSEDNLHRFQYSMNPIRVKIGVRLWVTVVEDIQFLLRLVGIYDELHS